MLAEQTGLYTLLKEFDHMCRKHDIEYYMEGGSVLGAIRHKGFLPWDDDVDLCMTRDNWQKLLAVLDDELPAGRELFCYERFPEYKRDTNKYTNLETTVTYPNHIVDGMACGQHIDVFVIDPAPADPEEKAEYLALATVYSELMMPVYVMSDEILKYMDLYKKYKKIMDEKGRDYTLNLLRDQLFTLEDTDETKEYYLRWGNRHAFYSKSFYGKPAEVDFEDGKFYVPPQYYRYLHDYFGDSWMIVPEAHEQAEHNSYGNMNIPCETFRADYAPFIDFDKMLKENYERKKHNLGKLAAEDTVKRDRAEMLKVMYEVEFEDLLPALSAEAQKLLDEQQFEKLADHFNGYCNAQLDRSLRNYGMLLDVDENVLYAAALSMAMAGRFGDAQKLILINKNNGGRTSDRLDHLNDLIVDVRECVILNEEGRYDEAKVLAEKWNGEFPLQLNMASFLIAQALREGKDVAQLAAEGEKLMEVYPNSDELMKLMGDLQSACGNEEDAKAWYRKCKASTRNGLLLMELADY